MKPKRKVTPYKGGRTTEVRARLTPEEKKRLQAILEGMSISDWIMKRVRYIEFSKKLEQNRTPD